MTCCCRLLAELILKQERYVTERGDMIELLMPHLEDTKNWWDVTANGHSTQIFVTRCNARAYYLVCHKCVVQFFTSVCFIRLSHLHVCIALYVLCESELYPTLLPKSHYKVNV